MLFKKTIEAVLHNEYSVCGVVGEHSKISTFCEVGAGIKWLDWKLVERAAR